MTPVLRIETENRDRSYRPGEIIRGAVEWHLPTAPKGVELRLFWFTRGRGTRDVEIVQRAPFDLPRAHDGRSFTLRAPAEPHSFSGKLISLVWALELVVEPGEIVERTELVISPSRREYALYPAVSEVG